MCRNTNCKADENPLRVTGYPFLGGTTFHFLEEWYINIAEIMKNGLQLHTWVEFMNQSMHAKKQSRTLITSLLS